LTEQVGVAQDQNADLHIAMAELTTNFSISCSTMELTCS